MKDEIEALHIQLKNLYGDDLPQKVAEEIYNHIPKKETSSDDEYIFLTQLYTFGEYKVTLSLLDKLYSSRMHNYGRKEELLYSFKPIKPGLIKNHRTRTPKGFFETVDEKYEPIGTFKEENNVFLVKETSWDDHKDDEIHTAYTIFVFNRNNEFEKEKIKHDKEVILELKKQMKGLRN